MQFLKLIKFYAHYTKLHIFKSDRSYYFKMERLMGVSTKLTSINLRAIFFWNICRHKEFECNAYQKNVNNRQLSNSISIQRIKFPMNNILNGNRYSDIYIHSLMEFYDFKREAEDEEWVFTGKSENLCALKFFRHPPIVMYIRVFHWIAIIRSFIK